MKIRGGGGVTGFVFAPVGGHGDEDDAATGDDGGAVAAGADGEEGVFGGGGPGDGLGMEPAGGVEPPIAAVDAGAVIGEVIGAAAEGADFEVVFGFGFAGVGEVLGCLGAAVAIEELLIEDAAAAEGSFVAPELGDAGEVADGGGEAAVGGAEEEAVLEFEGVGEAGGGLFGGLLEEAVEEGLLVEVDGEIVVGPGGAGGLGAAVAAGHGGEVGEGHGLVLGGEGPAEASDLFVEAFELAFLDGEEEEGSEDGFGGGEDVAAFGLIAPGFEGLAVVENATAAAEGSRGGREEREKMSPGDQGGMISLPASG